MNMLHFIMWSDAENKRRNAEETIEELQERIDKAIHRIQLLQMDGEVTIKDLGLIVKDLKGDPNERNII